MTLILIRKKGGPLFFSRSYPQLAERKRLWPKPGRKPKPIPKPGLHPKKRMLNILWDVKGDTIRSCSGMPLGVVKTQQTGG